MLYGWSPTTATFDTIVNFNAAIGDKWLRNRLAGACNGRGKVIVVDTGRVLINNLSLKKIVTTYTNTYTWGSNTFTVNSTDTIIDRIMSRSSFIFPLYCEMNYTQPVTDNPTLYNPAFKCYQDNSFTPCNKAGVADCEYDGVGIYESTAKARSFHVFPNPSSASVRVEWETGGSAGICQILVLNTLGQVLLLEGANTAAKGLTLNLGHMVPGVYYLQLSDETGAQAVEKIVRQ